jgi:hypothetical protein
VKAGRIIAPIFELQAQSQNYFHQVSGFAGGIALMKVGGEEF